MGKNDIYLGDTSKQETIFHKICPKKAHPCANSFFRFLILFIYVTNIRDNSKFYL